MGILQSKGQLGPYETSTTSSFTEFVWEPSCSNSYYDFIGDLHFCEGSDSTFGYWDERNDQVQKDGGKLRDKKRSSCAGLAPLIRMQAGKKYKLRLINDAEEETNLHTHGLHIPGDGNGDDPRRVVGSGQYLIYNLTIPEDHMDGTYWYHPHKQGLGGRQTAYGAMGMIIIDPADELLIEETNRPDWISNDRKLLIRHSSRDVYVNNKLRETVELEPNEWTRLRIVFAAAYLLPQALQFDDKACQVHTAAYDGVWRSTVPNPDAMHYIILADVARIDFAIKCNADSTLRYDGKKLVNFKTKGGNSFDKKKSVDMSLPDPWVPARPYYLQDLRNIQNYDLATMDTYEVEVRSNSLNFVSFDRNVPLASFNYDTIQQWTIKGAGIHPFHLHVFHMQIMTEGGCGLSYQEEGEFYDTITASSQGCQVRFPIIDASGFVLMHCHTFSHKDNGAAGWINVTSGPEPILSDYQPDEDSDQIC